MSDNILQKIMNPSQKAKIWWVFMFVTILAVSALLVDFGWYYNQAIDKYSLPLPKVEQVDFRLGLDLLGGTQLIYQADISAVSLKDQGSAVEGVRDVIERRVNVFGVSEPNVQVNKTAGGDYRILVELAGIKDVNAAIKMIGETPLLEFKEENNEIRQLTEEERQGMDEYNKQAEEKAEEVFGKVISGGDFSALAKQYSEDESTKNNDGNLDWIIETDNPELVNIAKELTIGQITPDLIKASNGYEIVKLIDRRYKTDSFTNEEEKEVEVSHLLICYEGATGCENGISKEEALNKISELKKQATINDFTDLVKQNSTEPGADISGGELGWFGRGMMVESFEKTAFDLVIGNISEPVETDFGYHLIYKKSERKTEEYKIQHIFIDFKTEVDIIGQQTEWKNTELTGKNLDKAVVQFDPNDNSPQVSLQFDSEGSNMFEEITSRNVDKPVAIFLDSYPISVPTVNEKITGGKAVISGKFTIQEAKLLTQRLNAGALPVPIELINQQTVGASLGKISVANSLRAGIIGLILVALFMIVYYRLPGVLSVLSLIIYGAIVLAVFKPISIWLAIALVVIIVMLMYTTFNDLKIADVVLVVLLLLTGVVLVYFFQAPITLTLAGMAGFILSIGMAVDANILIFSRMREELKSGKTLDMAIEEGFRRAWPSIRDGNLSTILTCLILIGFGTGAIQGFGTTLLIGVTISMFSAIVITRNFLHLFLNSWIENKKWLIGVKK